MGIIYYALNTINGKGYVGQTKNSLALRKRQHLTSSLYDGTYFHNAILKYGKENFEWIVLGEYPNNELHIWEQYWIKNKNTYYQNNCGYNMTEGGEISKTTTQKPVKCYIEFEKKDLYFPSITKAAIELNRLYPQYHFTQEYISRICHGEVKCYYKNFYFNFVNKDGQCIPTGYVDNSKKGVQTMQALNSQRVRFVSPDGIEYFYNSLTEMGKILHMDRHCIANSIKENRKILRGKYKGWQAFKVEAGG